MIKFERPSDRRVPGAFSCRLGGGPEKLSVNLRSKIQEQVRIQIQRLIHEIQGLTQRALGERVGVGLEAINCLLKALVERGLLKVHDCKKNPKTIVYTYLSTREKIAGKTLLIRPFLKRKMAEYEVIGPEIEGQKSHHQATVLPPHARPRL